MFWTSAGLLVCWLLGRLTHRALSTGPPGEGTDGLDTLATETFFGLALALWTALVLAQVGLFSALSWGLVLGLATTSLAIAGRNRPRIGWGLWDARAALTVALLAVVVILAIALYLPPFEQIVGGSDPTTYLLWGIRVAREGTWVEHDPLVAAMSPEQVEMFFGPGFADVREHYGSRFLGFYLEDPATGRVVPQGFPVYPIAVAAGYTLGGIRGALAVTPLLAILGVAAVLLAGRRLMSHWAAGLAAVWLAVSPAQVWFARYANAEIAAQVLLFAGVYAWLLHRDNRRPFFGLAAGTALGLSLLAHAWMVFVAIALYGLACAAFLRRRRQAPSWWLWGSLSVLVAHLLVTAATHAWPYVSDLLLSLATSDRMAIPFDHRRFPLSLVAGAGVGLAACWLLASVIPAKERAGPAVRRAAGAVGILTAAGVVLLAYLGSVVRPAGRLTWSALSIPQLEAAIGATGFWLAVLGAALALIGLHRWRSPAVFTLLMLPAVVAVLYRPLIRPEMMWSLRRYVPVIFPTFHLLGALALALTAGWIVARARGSDGSAAGVPARVVSGLAIGLIAAFGLHHGVQLAENGIQLAYVQHRAHAVEFIDRLAGTLDEEALLLFEARSGWRSLDYAPALAYWKGFDVLNTFRKQPPEELLRDYLWGQLRGDRPVYSFSQGFNYYFPSPGAVPMRPWVEFLEELESTTTELPSRIHTNRVVTNQYRLDAARRNTPLPGNGINCGHWDDYFVGEMYASEHDGRERFRWTEGNGRLWLAGIGQGAVHLTLRLGAPGADLGLDRQLTFRLDGELVARRPVRPGLHDYHLELPADPERAFAPMLEMNVKPFVPAELGVSDDRRWLGVRCYDVRWDPVN